MKKIKRLLFDSFLTQTANIGIIVVFLLIFIVQIYKLNTNWINDNLNWLYVFINSNVAILSIIITLIPLLSSFILSIIKRIKATKKEEYKEETKKTVDNHVKVFPGLIDKENIKGYTLVKDLETTSDYSLPLILDRDKQCNEIVQKINLLKDTDGDKFNCLYLTGMSGSGKSVLINEFLTSKIKENDSNDIVTIVNDNYYNGELIKKRIEKDKATIVIFDQFEDSLNYPRFFQSLKDLFENSNTKIIFIFSFPQNFFYQVNKRISELFNDYIEKDLSFINSNTHFITNDEYDIEEIKTIINRFTQEDFINIENCLSECRKCSQSSGSYKSLFNEEIYSPSLIFLCSILSRIEVGISPLVEFSTLSFIYELYEYEISANLEMYIDNLDNIIDLYLDKWVDKFPHSQTGKIILYLLSDGKNYTLDDIKFTTFEIDKFFDEKSSLTNIVDIIDENKFLNKKDNYSGFLKGFSTIHDYIGLKIHEYCFRNLDNAIRQNVDYYRRVMSSSNETRKPTAFSREKITIQKRYNRFNGKAGKSIVNFFLAFMCLSSLIIAIYISYPPDQEQFSQFGLHMSFGCFGAIYYYYNFIMQSTRILIYISYLPMLIISSIAVPCSFLFPGFFGIFMGIAVCSLGVTQFCLNFITKYDAKKHFMQTGFIYFIYGIVVIILGVAYLNEPNWIYHLLFILYVSGANYSHTKYSYVIKRIGKINTFKI